MSTLYAPVESLLQVIVKAPRAMESVYMDSRVQAVEIQGLPGVQFTVTGIERSPFDANSINVTLAPTRDAEKVTS